MADKKRKPRGKSRKWTVEQINEAARHDEKGADKLARELGGLTLALQNAISREN